MSKRLAIILGGIVLVGSLGTAFAYRSAIRETIAERTKPELPAAQPYQPPSTESSTSTPPPEKEPTPKPAPKPPAPPPKSTVNGASAEALAKGDQPSTVEVHATNLAVPFTVQAPYANWDELHQEACEEAALMMVHAFMSQAGAFTPEEAERQILAMVDWENAHFGYYKDTTAEETAEIAREYYGHANARALPVASMKDVLAHVEAGRPVILPTAGRMLGNPFFSGAGPLYHMVVVKGFTKDGKIITNDPGTRRGADYLYDPKVLFNAIHDWNGGDVQNGAKLMIVLE